MKRFLTREIVIASVVFLTALIMRLTFIWQWSATPYGAMPIVDAQAYDLWAQDIANGQILRSKAFYLSPLYPYILALLYKIFGHHFLVASLFNAFLDALSCAVLSLIALGCFGLEAALLTGSLAALDRQLIFYTAPIMKESLGFFLITLFLAAVLRALQSGQLKHFVLSGISLGLLALVRGNALLLSPAILLLAYIKRGRESLRGCVAFVLATTLFLLPATIHNAIASHDFVLLNYDDGYNFYTGNSPSANGTKANIGGVALDPINEEKDMTRIAEQVSGRTLRPSEISAFWLDKASDFIVHNPQQSLSLLLKKLGLFLYCGDVPDNYHIDFIAENFSTILSVPLPGFFLVSVAAAFSLVGLWRGRKNEAVRVLAVLAAIYMLSVLLFYVTGRYRLSEEAFLLPLAGAALPCAWKLVRFKRWSGLMAATACAALLLVVEVNQGPFDTHQTAYNYGILGVIYLELGQSKDALTWLRKAAEHGDTNAQNNLGVMYYTGRGVTRDPVQAIQWLSKAAESGDAVMQYNLGSIYYKGSPPDYAQAKKWLLKAAEQGYSDAENDLGGMYATGNGVPRDTVQAAQWFRKAATQGNANAQSNLEVLSHQNNTGPKDESRAPIKSQK